MDVEGQGELNRRWCDARFKARLVTKVFAHRKGEDYQRGIFSSGEAHFHQSITSTSILGHVARAT